VSRPASKCSSLKMLHPDFNVKLFEPVATLSGAGAEAEGITVAIRPLHSSRPPAVAEATPPIVRRKATRNWHTCTLSGMC
jgi:hypothetical protein